MEIVNIDVNDLIPYENNPRINDAAVKYVAESISEFGFRVPIVIDSENVIIAGHTRLKAAKKIGLKSVPCLVADDLSEEQVSAFRLADNKVSEQSDWDFSLLDLEIMSLSEIDMSKFGFDDIEESLSEDPVQKNINLDEMELKAFEHYDYIVFVFKNQMDWLNAVSHFKIKKVKTSYGKTKKTGIGRVLDGKRLLELL